MYFVCVEVGEQGGLKFHLSYCHYLMLVEGGKCWIEKYPKLPWLQIVYNPAQTVLVSSHFHPSFVDLRKQSLFRRLWQYGGQQLFKGHNVW